ncbi:MAG: ABC transporter permease subunit [bacterium]|nr:ABC transporter permease subunit [bacterium]
MVIALRYLALMIVDAFALILIYGFLEDQNLGLALILGVITVGANIFVLVPSLFPIKWMTPGLMLITLLVIYPVFYTVLTAFTNRADGHILNKSQVVDLLGQQRYVPEGAQLYEWTLYRSEDGTYALWLTGDDGNVAFAPAGAPIIEVESPPEEAPPTYEGYTQLTRAERTQALTEIQNLVFGEGEDTAGIQGRSQAARPLESRYVYDEERDALIDQSTGTAYIADNQEGLFRAERGSEVLQPGYQVNVGFRNFERLVNDPGLRGPLLQVFVWTVTFALLSVLTTFAVGLFMALILNDNAIPGRKIIRSLLIIPYAIPGVIAIGVWRGMLNENLGIIGAGLGSGIGWQTDPWGVKFGILLINLWLGYPYMMLISSGALQAIPSEVYEAAAVDGATPVQRFWRITLPLLLITMGPLLIASFTYNFNNFLIIEAYNAGNPPIPGTNTPAGYSDILISYTYRLAFGAGRGADYGYAAAITIIIFAIVAIITLMQFRLTRRWEEAGANV